MEENNLELNEKLYSFEGVIGRHGYLVNLVIICALSALVMLPYTTYFYTHAGSVADFFNFYGMFNNAPVTLKFWMILGTGAVCALSASNICRRLNDISGEIKVGTNVALCLISIAASFSFMMPLSISSLFVLMSFVISIVLLVTKGKITGALPYDYKKEFNWGAFWGTWIWGLFNKSYIPLWELLLWLTPFGFYFQMYCGLKGNEWAFKNKNCEDVDKFNKSQKTQGIIFTVLSLVVFPILYLSIIIALVAGLSVLMGGNNPQEKAEKSAKIESSLNRFTDSILSLYFQKYDIGENENKFYVIDEEWSGADFKDKKDMLDLAATKSAEVKRQKFKEQNPDKQKFFSKTEELHKTKIYSSNTGKLLGEFVVDEKAMNGSFTDAFKAALKAYRFYNAD